MSGPAERLRENAVEVASLLVTGLWMAALFTGQEWWWAALIVGYVVVIPIVEIAVGDDEGEESDREWGWPWDESDEDERRSDAAGDEDDALATLRERYARGELTDEQFERKLERLLEVETIEDASEHVERAREQRRNREAEGNRAREYE
ncbi:SHOCT domain-containing protein [Halomicrobium salinisoli]|uniref:SHOCT domain-containing protein n=1 Tax=Halomicrobium salinisoli TaxID=2878391 RepID=UPI001CF0154F|nr:SHOCT domain-containing protein [Halomicrobium salinisoli]